MPDWIINRVTAPSIVIDMLTSEDDKGDLIVDFNNIIKMPDEDMEPHEKSKWYWDHWGTKWNAHCYSRPSKQELIFQTAWECPFKVFEQLPRRFGPIIVEYANEGIGNNCGIVHITQADGVEHFNWSGTDEGVKLWSMLWDLEKEKQHSQNIA